MSLTVDVYVLDSDGKMDLLDVPDGANDAVGGERWRTLVWGSDAVSVLGSRFFVRLASDDLYVPPEELEDFEIECKLLATHVADIAPRNDPGKSYEEFKEDIVERLTYILEAIKRATQVSGGGVVIW